MNSLPRLLLAFLLSLFTFNQVVLAHLFPEAVTDYETACFEHDTEDESTGLPINPKQSLGKFIRCQAAVIVPEADISEEEKGTLPHLTSPHGLHVPIYLDHRSLIV